MTDTATIAAYDADAASFAEDWETQPPPTDLQDAVRRFFRPGPTADIGCGSGRDTAWLAANGFAATGFDASEGLLGEARRRHPGIRFVRATLPELTGIADASFTNVLCETVIMHLPPEIITAAVKKMIAILVPGGTLYLSWRVTENKDRRDEHGRSMPRSIPISSLRAWRAPRACSTSSGRAHRPARSFAGSSFAKPI